MAGVIRRVPRAWGRGSTENRINLLPWLLYPCQIRTVRVPQDSTKHKIKQSFDSPHPKCSCKVKGTSKGSKKKSEWRSGRVEVCNERSLYPKHCPKQLHFMSSTILRVTPCKIKCPRVRIKLKSCRAGILDASKECNSGFYFNVFLVRKASRLKALYRSEMAKHTPQRTYTSACLLFP